MSKKEEVPFKLKAYRTLSLVDEKYQNYRQAETVELRLVVEIDGVDIQIAQDVLPYATWEHMKKTT
jgi:hypothetical protein